MSTINMAPDFNPTARVVEPENRPDQLAEAVLASLSRGRWGYRGRPWGVIKTFFVSYFTLGIGPLLCWPSRMRNFMSSEQQQLWQLAEWLRLRTGKPEATALRDHAAREVSPNVGFSAANFFIVLFAVLMVLKLVSRGLFDFGTVWNVDWTPNHRGFHMYAHFFPDLPLWTLLLLAGYLLYWLHICLHASALESYVTQFNAITASEGIEPVVVPPVGAGLNIAWIILALVGLSSGAIWAIPLALAGAVQSRYVWVTSRQTRAELANRVRIMLSSARPALNVRTTPRASSRICSNEKCHAPLRPGATFCPRCGTRTT